MRSDTSPMTEQEEAELTTAWQTRKDQRARDRMVMSVYRLMYDYARKAARSRNVLQEDLLQEAMMGVMRACDTFDPSRARFTTYAMLWARAAVNRRLAVDRTLISQTALRPGAAYQKQNERVAQVQVLWLDAVDEHMMDSDKSARDVALLCARNELHEVRTDDADIDHERKTNELMMLVADLPKRERWVVEQRFLARQPRTLQQLADEIGLSRERVRQLEANALRKLKKQAKGLFDS